LLRAARIYAVLATNNETGGISRLASRDASARAACGATVHNLVSWAKDASHHAFMRARY
jgi:hypothetical protein